MKALKLLILTTLFMLPSLIFPMHRASNIDKHFITAIKQNNTTLVGTILNSKSLPSPKTLYWAISHIALDEYDNDENEEANQTIFTLLTKQLTNDKKIPLSTLLESVANALDNNLETACNILEKPVQIFLIKKKQLKPNANLKQKKLFHVLIQYISYKSKIIDQHLLHQTLIIAAALDDAKIICDIIDNPYIALTNTLLADMLYANYYHGTKETFNTMMKLLLQYYVDNIAYEGIATMCECSILWNDSDLIKTILKQIKTQNNGLIEEADIGYALEYAAEKGNKKNIDLILQEKIVFHIRSLCDAIKNAGQAQDLVSQKKIMAYLILEEYNIKQISDNKNKKWFKQLKKLTQTTHAVTYLKKYEKKEITSHHLPYQPQKNNFINCGLFFDHPNTINLFCKKHSLPLTTLLHNAATWFSPKSVWFLLGLIATHDPNKYSKCYKKIEKWSGKQPDQTLCKTVQAFDNSLYYFTKQKKMKNSSKIVPRLSLAEAAYMLTFVNSEKINFK